jgi:hypothetical protein
MLSEAGEAEIEKFGAGRIVIVQLAVTVPAAKPEESTTFADTCPSNRCFMRPFPPE